MYVVHVLHKVLGRTTNDVLDTRDKIITCTLCYTFLHLLTFQVNSSQFNFSYYLKKLAQEVQHITYTQLLIYINQKFS